MINPTTVETFWITVALFLPNFVFNTPDSALPFYPEMTSLGLFFLLLSRGQSIQLSHKEKVGLFSGFLILLILGYSAWVDYSSSLRPCDSPPFPHNMECLGMSSDLLSTAPRQFFYLLTGALLSVCCFIYSKQNHYRPIFHGVIASATLLACAEAFAYMTNNRSLLPEFLRYEVEIWNHQSSAWFGNPGWGWPYLGLASCLILWHFLCEHTSVSKTQNIFYALCWLIINAIIIFSLQRAILFLYLFQALGTLVALEKIRPKTLFLFSGCFVTISIGTIFSVDSLKVPFLHFVHNEPRIQLWQAAYSFFLEEPLYGIGYANWFDHIRDYLNQNPSLSKAALLKPTSHNLFIQSLTELGGLLSLIIYSFFIIIIRQVLHKKSPPQKKIFVLLFSLTFLAANLFQNMTYIRPLTFLYAGVLGMILGSYLPRSHNQKTYSTRFLGVFGAIMLLYSLWGFRTLTIGGYAFEISETQTLRRWLNPSTSITVIEKNHKSYQEFTMIPSFKQSLQLKTPSFEGVIQPQSDTIQVPFDAGPWFWPTQQSIKFEKGHMDHTRRLASWLVYEPTPTNLAIFHSKKLGSWEKDNQLGSRLWKWCEEGCEFLPKTCGNKNHLHFSIQAPPLSPKNRQITLHLSNVDPTSSPWSELKKQTIHLPDQESSIWDIELPTEGFTMIRVESNYNFKALVIHGDKIGRRTSFDEFRC